MKNNTAFFVCLAFTALLGLNNVLNYAVHAADDSKTADDLKKGENVATVNGEPITRIELADFLIDSFGKEGMEILIRRVLVEQEAKKQNILITEEEINNRIGQVVDAEVKKLKGRYGKDAEAAFKEDLDQMGYDLEKLRDKLGERVLMDVRPQLLAEKLIRNTITIKESDLKDVYQLKYGEKIEVRQIVVKTKEEGEEILRKIKSGADFGALAKEKSLDRPSAAKGGLMEPFSINTQLGKNVSQFKDGEVTDVVQSRNGYHIFKIERRVPPDEIKSYEEALPEIKEVVMAINLQKRSGPWFLNLIENSEINNYLEKK